MIEDCGEEARVRLEFATFPENATVKGDPVALRQAFSNLLRNSAEAMTDGEEPRLELSAAADNKNLRISLRDNGCGISQELMSRIFIPFFTTKPAGTGLGLA